MIEEFVLGMQLFTLGAVLYTARETSELKGRFETHSCMYVVKK